MRQMKNDKSWSAIGESTRDSAVKPIGGNSVRDLLSPYEAAACPNIRWPDSKIWWYFFFYNETHTRSRRSHTFLVQ